MSYRWVVYILIPPKRRSYFCKSIVMQMGSVSLQVSKVWQSGVDATLLSEHPWLSRTMKCEEITQVISR